MKRTHYCGAIRKEHMGQTATLCGWVQNRRDMGGVIFLDVKDREGVAPGRLRYAAPAAGGLPPCGNAAYAERDSGGGAKSVHRDEETYNPRLATGEVELLAKRLVVLSEAQPLPYSMDEDAKVREELRLKYRYLDLRRSAVAEGTPLPPSGADGGGKATWTGTASTCIETPMLCKSTPEGARDYLVPSRVHPGKLLRPAAVAADFQAAAAWSAAWTSIIRSPAASATRISAPTASRSSRRSTWKCRLWSRRISSSTWSSLFQEHLP